MPFFPPGGGTPPPSGESDSDRTIDELLMGPRGGGSGEPNWSDPSTYNGGYWGGDSGQGQRFPDSAGYGRGTGGRTPGADGPGLGIPHVQIVIKRGTYYFSIRVPQNPSMPPSFVCRIYRVENADLSTDEGVEKAYESGAQILDVPFTTDGTWKVVIVDREIEKQYQSGFFFARYIKETGIESDPSALVPFQAEGNYITPNRIKNFYMDEDGEFVQGSGQQVSVLSIQYDPPDDQKGFWGVALYVEGYQGSTDLQLVTMRKYPGGYDLDPLSPTDYFNVYLEPDAAVKMENYLQYSSDKIQNYTSGSDEHYVLDYQQAMVGAQRAIKLRYINEVGAEFDYSDGCDREYASFTMEAFTGSFVGGAWAPSDPTTAYKFNNTARDIRHGDTIVLMNQIPDSTWFNKGTGDTNYLCEGIIDKLDDTNPQRKLHAFLRYYPSYVPAHTYDDPDAVTGLPTWDYGTINGQYLSWKILQSCKFYLVAINAIGYHGDIAAEGLVQYVALDGVESGPIPPTNIKARQYEIQNSVRWTVPPNEYYEHFNIYRQINEDTVWNLIGMVKYKSVEPYDPGPTLYTNPVPYEFTDMDMSGVSPISDMYEYVSTVAYGVSATDKAGRESIISRADHYDVNGVPYQYFSFRRTVGIDHSIGVVTRNNPFNLLWNAELDWSQDGVVADTDSTVGNCPAYEWSLRNNVAGHTALALTWNDSTAAPAYANTFRIDFADANTRDMWARLVLQMDSTTAVIPGATTWPPGLLPSSSYIGLGRVRLCIPSMGYSTPIYVLARYDNAPNYYLYLAPTDKWRPKVANGTVWSASSYYLSVGYGTTTAGTDVIPANPTTMTIGATTERWVWRNGWYYRSTDTAGAWATPFTNGMLSIPAPTLAASGAVSTWNMILPKEKFYRGQYLTFSCQSAKDTGVSLVPTGIFGCRLYFLTSNRWDPNQAFTYSSDLTSASCQISEMATTGYSYHAFYMKVPDSTVINDAAWANVTAVLFTFGILYLDNVGEITIPLKITRPMLNDGNEAAPFTSQMPEQLTGRFMGGTASSGNPTPPDERSDMCVAFGQSIMLGNGEEMGVEYLKEGMFLRSCIVGHEDSKINVCIKKIEYATRPTIVFHFTNGVTMEVTDEHLCVLACGAILVPASDVEIGMTMTYKDGKSYTISNIVRRHASVAKISTTYPHMFYVNGILTHNLKVGEGEV